LLEYTVESPNSFEVVLAKGKNIPPKEEGGEEGGSRRRRRRVRS